MAEHVERPYPDLDSRIDKRICVVGAGVNGLALLKILADTPQVKSGQWTVNSFEERDNVGGVWLPSPATGDIPATPLYDSLTTNIPHPVMAFGSFPFPPETPLYPAASVVLKYLQDYTDHFGLRQFIRFNCRLERAYWNSERGKWEVTLSGGEQLDFDVLLVSNGHYRLPRYPDTAGVTRWVDAGKAMHSVWYRRPEQLSKCHKIVVVGGGPSARDLCVDLCAIGKHVLQSKHQSDAYGLPDSDAYRKVPPVAEYRDDGDVVFEDGARESGVDFVVFATGYEASFPFLSDQQLVRDVPTVPPPFPERLHNSTYHIFPLAKHLFPIQTTFPYHTAAFTGLLTQVPPFPVCEDQARAIMRVIEDPTALDVASESVALVERAQRLIEAGHDSPLAVAKAWFKCSVYENFEYREELRRFADPNDSWKAPDPLVWMWERKAELRSAWEDVERRGQAEQWLKGVGCNGLDDWMDLCRKLLGGYQESLEQSSPRL